MEVNRDAAQQCVDKAKAALRAGDAAKATRFLDRGERLYPGLADIQRLRKVVADLGSSPPAGSGSPAPAPAASSGEAARLRRRKRADPAAAMGASKPYTPEQQQEAERILKCDTHYDVLGVEKTATPSAIKKAYHKLALKFHPDKNTAPGAEEAFKKIGTAFAVLNDEEKRRNYNTFGHEDGAQAAQQENGGGGRTYYGQAMSAEDLFNMFFNEDGGNGYVRMHHQFGHGRRFAAAHDAGPPNPAGRFLQLMPLLAVLLVTMLSYSSSPEPYFRLQQSGSYQQRRTTGSVDVVPGLEYWVKSDFRRQIGRSSLHLREVEMGVQRAVYTQLKRSCQFERGQQQQLQQQASFAQGQRRKALKKQAVEFRMPSCEELGKFSNFG